MERERCHYCRRIVYNQDEVPKKKRRIPLTPTEDRRLKQMKTRDHVLSSASGQRIDDDCNIVISCLECNRTKCDAPYEVFIHWVRNTDAAHRHDLAAFGRFRYSLTLSGFKNLLRDGYLPTVDARALLARLVKQRERKLKNRALQDAVNLGKTNFSIQAPYTLRDLKRQNVK